MKPNPSLPRTGNRHITLHGVTRTVKEWAALTGVNYHTIMYRVRRGKAPEDCLTAGRVERANTGAGKRARYLTVGKVTLSVKKWSDVTGIHPATIADRIRRELTPEECIKAVKYPMPRYGGGQ